MRFHSQESVAILPFTSRQNVNDYFTFLAANLISRFLHIVGSQAS
jgi:hypothetical protein